MLHPTSRFSNRVDNYVKYRPSYPDTLIAFLKERFQLSPQAPVADLGSGTGILTALLLQQGWEVYGVEPNAPMRAAAENYLAGYPRFHSINGTGEQTTLPDASVVLVTVAQAFHWFQPEAAKKEFRRILQPGGHIALIWNLRTLQSPFAQAYENIKKQYGTDYEAIRKTHEPDLHDFFAPAPMQVERFSHAQLLDKEGLKGQLLSSSYIPLEGQPGHKEMLEATDALFDTYQENGLVQVPYETKLYYNG